MKSNGQYHQAAHRTNIKPVIKMTSNLVSAIIFFSHSPVDRNGVSKLCAFSREPTYAHKRIV
jgi:hypothetical protein